MSIILKGIDLPTNGETLVVGIYGNGLVSVEHSKPLVLPIEINADAIQIPKGHGRIGDLEKLAKLLSNFGESLKESARGNKLLMTERDICHAMAVLTEHFQEYEPLLEAEEDEC